MAEPLFLKSVMHEKIWGGTQLQTVFGYDIPSDQTGEYWAISAHPNGVSTVANGRYVNTPLDRLYKEQPYLFGFPKSDVFPLLIKILDAQKWLSVQVHPDDTYAFVHEGELGKTECWYVLEAKEGAQIVYGHTAKNKNELKEMMDRGDWENLLTYVDVKKGDFFYVPSGTMHAIGEGIVILETQQSSDTTYRVYDFDRVDDIGEKRELHLDKSIDVLTIGEPANSTPARLILEGLETTVLVSNEFFTVYRWLVNQVVTMHQVVPYLLVSVTGGTGEIIIDNCVYTLKKGDHFILPNDVKSWQLNGTELEMIVSYSNG